MARRHAQNRRFAFGTWKIEILGGFASALFLIGVAVLMVVGSVERILAPKPIAFKEAIIVAILGLLVNLGCALILGGHTHDHGHDHGHEHHHGEGEGHGHHHHDLNLRSAYLHVLADAATSVCAILALIGGMFFGWNWLDPVMGLVGAVLVALWAKGLIRDTSKVLLDAENDHPVTDEICEVIAAHPEWGAEIHIADLHVWRVGKGRFACILALEKTAPGLSVQTMHEALSIHEEIVHLSVELR